LREFFNISGLMDSFSTKDNSLKKYQEKLQHYQKKEAETIIDMGIIYLKNEQNNEALEKFREALQIYRKMRYSEGEALANDLIGDTYLNERNTSKALQHYQESFKIYSFIKSKHKNELFEKIKDSEKAQEAMELLKGR
jgi:tetratricopeptide (TPR) repeat protein